MVIEMIYLDLVFILNFIYDFLLLVTTGLILKRIFSIKRIFLSSLMGSICVFLLFLEVSSFVLFILKILISIIMVYISFGKRNIFTNIMYLYMNSIILAGFIYFLNIELSYSRSNLTYYFTGFNINYLVVLIFAPIILFIYFKQMKVLKERINLVYNVEIILLDNSIITLTGFIDSGNRLKDPTTNKYIIIVDKNIFISGNYMLVPFNSVNKSGLLKCYKIKCIKINGKEFTNYLVGVSDNDIKVSEESCILNYKLMEDLNV